MRQIFSRRQFFALGIALGLVFGMHTVAMAAPSADASVKFIKGLGDKALSSLTDKTLSDSEREKRVRQLLKQHFDVDAIGKFALGTYWRKATAAEQKEYLSLFEDMVVKTYAQRFAEYSGQNLEIGKAIEAGKDTIVNSKILQKNGPPITLQWRVRGSNSNMKVIDVTVEGISMSVTQRSDFASVIQSGNGEVETLLASLRQRQKEG